MNTSALPPSLTRRTLVGAFVLLAVTLTSACASGRRPGSYLPIGASSWYGDSTNDGVVLLVHANTNVAAQMAEGALKRSGYSLDPSDPDPLVLRTISRTFAGDTSVVVSVEIIAVELPEPGASVILRGTYSVRSRRIRNAPVLERVGESNPVYAHVQSIARLIKEAQAPTPPEPPATAAAPAPVPTPAAIDSFIGAKMAEAGLVGVAGSVFIDGREVWSKGYGHRDYLRTQPFTPTTPMTIASITKTFTSVAMMRLVAEGKLDLDADVSRYLPFSVRNPRFPDIPITLRMIATHTSSITDRWEIYRDLYHWGGDAPESLSDFITSYFALDGDRYSADNYTTVAPGTARDYSNIGAGLVGFIVERLSGERLDVYTQRHIISPLGMRSTGWFLRDLPTAELSTHFVERDGWAIPLPRYGLTTYPDGGVRTSVSDLSRFFQALLNHGEYDGARILPAAQADEMTRFQFSGPEFPEGYGPDEGNSGLFWRTRRNGEFIGHGGSDPGVQTVMLSTVNRRLAVVLFANTSGGQADRAFDAIFLALKAYGDSQMR